MNYDRFMEQLVLIDRSQEIRNVGMVLFDQGKYSEALSKFEESLRLNPNDIKARQYRGMCTCLLAAPNPAELREAILDFKIVLYQVEASSFEAARLINQLT